MVAYPIVTVLSGFIDPIASAPTGHQSDNYHQCAKSSLLEIGPPSGGAINKKDINTEKISMAPAQG